MNIRKIFLLLLVTLPLLVTANVIDIKKPNDINFKKNKIVSNHKMFNQVRKFDDSKRNGRNNRVLVLMVDFQEDNESITTGNGKFTLSDSNYAVSLGAPPRNQEYFGAIMQSVKNYYLAVSYGSFEIEGAIYPQPSEQDTSIAYTLPHKMSYYHPQDNDLFLERTVAYFHDAFRIADETSPNLDFSDYDHYILIHAGADWQHDVNRDSQSDLPSIHVSFGDDQTIFVDEGETEIKYAISCPETMTQDGSYGVPTSTIAHELGHSLGLVDLYNTVSNYPGVGYWDLMDSGGSASMYVPEFEDYGAAYVEGAVPGHFGAWSKVLIWEEEFRERGILKDFDEINFDEDFVLTAAGAKNDDDENLYIVKIPINDKEYILLENRQVDADDSGLPTFQTSGGDLQKRVILGPIGEDDEYSYEYDYVLPGWNTFFNGKQNNVGGGILAWYINEDVIYDQGKIIEGEFHSNFEINQVNIDFFNRGVRIIEADNISDIGNPSSSFWRGTRYETFFPYIGNEKGVEYQQEVGDTIVTDTMYVITDWILNEPDSVWVNELSSDTKPELLTVDNEPVPVHLYDIFSDGGISEYRNFSGKMKMKIGYLQYDSTMVINRDIPELDEAEIIDMEVLQNSKKGYFSCAILAKDKVFFTNYSENGWQLLDTKEIEADSVNVRLIKDENSNIILTNDKTITKFSGDSVVENIFECNFLDTPVYDGEFYYISTIFNIHKLDPESLEILDTIELRANLAFDGEKLIAKEESSLNIIDTEDFSIEKSFAINTRRNLVCFRDTLNDISKTYFLDSDKNLIKYEDDKIEKIFSVEEGFNKASNIALIENPNTQQLNIVFAIDNLIYALSSEGTLLENFPIEMDDFDLMNYSNPICIYKDEEIIFMIKNDDNNYLAFNALGDINYSNSLFANLENEVDFYSAKNYDKFFRFHLTENKVYSSFDKLNSRSEDKVLWSGYKNGMNSLLYGRNIASESDQEFSVVAFPNPCQNVSHIRVRGHQSSVKLTLFDIAGNKIIDNNYDYESTFEYQDIELNLENSSSGVYFAILKTGSKVKKLKIVVEK